MTEIGFAPKEIIPQEVCRLEVLSAETADTYGPQIGLKVVGGEYEGHTFMDYANRDEDTGQIKQGLQSLEYLRGLPGPRFPQTPWYLPGEPRRQMLHGPSYPNQDRKP